MAWGLLAALGAALAFGVAAFLQAVSARRERTTDGVDPGLLLRLLRQPAYVVAVVLNLVGFGLHLVGLRSAPLFLVQAAISSSVAVTAVLAARLLGAPFGRVEQTCVAAVCAGLFVLAVAAQAHGTVTTTTGQRFWLLAAAVAILAVGAAVGRSHSEAASAVLSFLSGCGYAVVALSARVVPSLDVATLVRDPATYALVLAGVGAFLLYSTALQRAGVLLTTSVLVTSQTAVPALVGVVLLGDTVRPGWALPAVAAFLVALAAAVTLARRDTLAEVGAADVRA